MLILNITFIVSNQSKEKWLKWVKEKHIPFMLKTEYFHKAQIARVISNEESEGTSYAVQFETDSYVTLEKWNQKYAGIFQKQINEEFSASDVLFFSTILEII